MKTPRAQSGFSLVETLVSITILLIVIVGPMSIASSAARSTSFASEQAVAFFLAQEGAEIAQKAREDILLQYFPDNLDSAWDEFADDTSGSLYEDCFATTGCGLELSTDAIGSIKTPLACTGSVCQLYYDSGGDRSRYTHTIGATQTPYTRVITFNVVNDHEIRVVSIVYWRTGSQRDFQQVAVETYLLDVYGN